MHELIFNWYEMNLKIITLCALALPFKSLGSDYIFEKSLIFNMRLFK